jgi:hypothetical protein
MRTKIRSGRCWVPPEWRDPLEMGMLQRSAIVAVTGARDRNEACHLLAAHLPLLPPDEEDEDLAAELDPVPDVDGARRMARRMSRFRAAAGLRELLSAGFIPRHIPAVYAWRAARHGEHVFRVGPDGSFVPVALFRAVRVQDQAGQSDRQLVASRPW